MSTVIKVENVSKQYRLGLVGTGTMRDDLEGWWYRMRGKEDPTLKLGETNDRTSSSESNYVWALRDVNFDVKQGEVLGIIGKNGAGKSTLLKLLSRVTAPTIGNIKVKGRIASLLEVGTGFHPELTGKENIFLNGAIMGMKKHEIARKLDEIVDFAGVERYLETPVKRYSSGMYVRLAFAVAAHLEPEILIVDEVLAVGDAEFQKKALGKMKEVSSGGGRTVIFVSHNMEAVTALCNKGILMENGVSSKVEDIKEVVSRYLNSFKQNQPLLIKDSKQIVWHGIKNINTYSPYDEITINFGFYSNHEFKLPVFVDFAIANSKDEMIIHSRSEFINKSFNILENTNYKLEYKIHKPYLAPGDYSLTIYFYTKEGPFYWAEKIKVFRISALGKENMAHYLQGIKSVIVPEFNILID
jgi:lipopolysaccharide transport system ATP-binding protein